MTIRRLLVAVFRRWYVMLAVLAIGAALAFFLVSTGGTYSTKTVGWFTYAGANPLSLDNGSNSESLIAFAGAVAAEVNDGKPVPRYSSSDAPYYGAGLRQGVAVGLRDAGSQWASSFGSAIIEIQIVGTTREWVENMQTKVLDQLENQTAAQQAVGGAPAEVVFTVQPLTSRIDHVVPSSLARLSAFAALGLAVVITGGAAAAALDTYALRRSRRAGVQQRRRERLAS